MKISTRFLDKDFENPFILASGPPTATAAMIRKGFEAGWAGAVIKTLDPEPVINLKNRFASLKTGKRIYAFKNIELLSETSPQQWFEDIFKLKNDFPEKLIIGSVMGNAGNKEQWISLTKGCQDAGADFVELNFSCPHGYPEKGMGSAIGQNPAFSEQITRWVKESSEITIPVIPKLSAAVTDISWIGEHVKNAGADGISAINTIPSLMGFNLKTLQPLASVDGYTTPGGFSGPAIKPIALRCVNDLVKSPGLPVMAGGGISSGYDAVEFHLLGAPVTQVCTEVMLHGYDILVKMKKELSEFMGWHGFENVADFVGKGASSIKHFSELSKDFDVKFRIIQEKCNHCGNCYVSCRDAAYQAIEKTEGKYWINPEKCTGCSLCYQVCPTEAIEPEKVS